MPENALIATLDAFCTAFERRDRDAVMRLLAPGSAVTVVTSEEPLLRGQNELGRFLDIYVDGPTTYAWQWTRQEAFQAGSVGWLLAEGTETATTGGRQTTHPYRMTMVCENRDGGWWIRQVHGSSPHGGGGPAALSE